MAEQFQQLKIIRPLVSAAGQRGGIYIAPQLMNLCKGKDSFSQ